MAKYGRIFNIGKLCQRHFASQTKNIVIAGAVRSPLNYEDVSKSTQISTLAVEAVIKRSTLPRESIDGLYLVSPNPEIEIRSITTDLLSKDINVTKFKDDSQAFQSAFDKLHSNCFKSIIVAGLEVLPAFEFSNGSYDEEIFPVTLPQKRRNVLSLAQNDNKIKSEGSQVMIATGLAIMTNDTAHNLNIRPLADLLSSAHFYSKEDQPAMIRKLFDKIGLNLHDVFHWEIDSAASAVGLSHSLGLNRNCFHTNSIPGLTDQSLKTTLQFVHLVNCLKPGKFGCAVVHCLKDDSTGIFLFKNSNATVTPPILTLFTKDSCPLCDLLIEELKNNFANEYLLEKVFIDRKENVRFLRLYRYDIPVLFFNGQFLCMHRLNIELLRKKLNEIKIM